MPEDSKIIFEMNEKISVNLRIASLIATVMVVYRHSLNYLAFFNSWTREGYNGFIQDGIMRITEVAVPYFFAVSGFFFFKYTYDSRKEYFDMLQRKGRSLGLPFLFWNFIGACVLFLVSPKQIGCSLGDCIRNLLTSNWYGPLWYVRDLFLLMASVPVYGWLFRIDKWYIYLMMFALTMYHWIPVDTSILSSEGILFFLLGGIIRKNVHSLSTRIPVLWLVILALLWIVNSFAGYILFPHKVNTCLGIFVFWQLLWYVGSSLKEKLLTMSAYSFLIYVLHFYVIKAMKIPIGRFFYGNDFVSLLSYLLLPIVTIFVIVQFGKIFKTYMPRVYSLTTGNR